MALCTMNDEPRATDDPLKTSVQFVRGVGPERMKLLRGQFRVWERCGGAAGIEDGAEEDLAAGMLLSPIGS